MTKSIWAIAFLAISVSTSSVFADPSIASSTITLSGTVPSTCSLGSPTLTSGAGNFISISGADGALSFTQFTNTDGTHTSQTLTLTFPQSMCNYSAYLGLSSLNGGMKPTGTVTNPSFANTVNYTATATWGTGGPKTTLTTSSGKLGDNNMVAISPTSANLTLMITTTTTTLPLMANGQPFTDTLILQIGAHL